MDNLLIRQAYKELAYLRQCLDGAERNRLRSAADLRQRVAVSEYRIRVLETAAYAARS
jgi:hypothetical protein